MGIRYSKYKDEINCKDFFRPSRPLFHGIIPMLDETESKTCTKTKKVINRGKKEDNE